MKAEQAITISLVAAIGYLFYLIMVPFWIPLFWAIVLTILFYPMYKWLRQKTHLSDWSASLLTCIAITMFITIPVTLISAALVNELIDIYAWTEVYIKKSAIHIHGSPSLLFSYIKDILDKYIDVSIQDIQNVMLKSVKEGSSFMVQNLKGMITNVTGFVLNVILSLFAMFYLFKDGDKMIESIKGFLPLNEEDKRTIFRKNREVIYATLYGGVLVAIAQGCIGGISFWILGLSSPIFWGTLMAVLSFLPMVGPAIIWVPAAIYLLFKISYIKGVIMVVFGVFVIGLVDNLLRPIIVSGKTKIHPLLLFFSILGALKVLGFIGIIAGPIIISLTLAAMDIYKVGYLKKKG